MWKNIVQPDRPQMAIFIKRIACWIPKATNTNSYYVILTAFPLKKRLHECALMLGYIAVPALFTVNPGEVHNCGLVIVILERNWIKRIECTVEIG